MEQYNNSKILTKDYFDDIDDDDDDNYNNNANNNNDNNTKESTVIVDDDDDDDPLEAFMAGITEQVKSEQSNVGNSKLPDIVSGNYDDLDYDDYISKYNDNNENDNENDDEKYEYDSDGNIISGSNKKGEAKSRIEPLPPVDHNKIQYKPFKKGFYVANDDIKDLSKTEIDDYRNELEISVIGNKVPDPIKTFEQAGFDPLLLAEIKRIGYVSPTSVQAQALPVALSGRDMIGLAKTGSGKTLSFVWPMIVHILDQPQMQIGDGPIGLILAPTRELATQIHTEANKFCKIFKIRVSAIIGGSGKWEMTKALREAPEIVVATPGRFIDLVKAKATNLQRCTMVVLDEADRMFEMGFEYQMRSIVNNIRPDRQTLLFSATMKKKVETFAREILTDPVRVVVGSIGQANPDIQQVVEIFQDDTNKLSWLFSRADEFIAEGKVLIFVSSKVGTESIAESLRKYFIDRQLAVGIECLHGDKDQNERALVMKKFSKTEETCILVATDVAARGLDVKNIRTVVNYEAPKNIETYVHRIGRTGRMGQEGVTPGTAFTLLTTKDSSFAVDLVNNLLISSLEVPSGLQSLAMQDVKWDCIKNKLLNHHGLGSGFNNKAMTSSMAAASSKGGNNINMNTNMNTNFDKLYDHRQLVNSIPTNAVSQTKPHVHALNSFEPATISGFVRAKDVANNSTSSNIITENNQPRKRSRWDT